MSVTIDLAFVSSVLGCMCLTGVPVLIAILLANKYRVIERDSKEGKYYDD